MPTHPRRPRVLAVGAGLALAGGILSGCTGAPVPNPTTAPTPSVGTSEPSPTATAEAELHPDGSAADNLPLFTAVTQRVWDSAERAKGRAYVDALAAAGFDISAMQVTSDTTTVGNAAESLQFSVLWRDECLVGQVGEATGEPVTAVLPALADGSCLVGRTVPID